MTAVTASVISTGEAEALRGCLMSLVRQRFDGTLRVVVVCNGVQDDSGVLAGRIVPDAIVLTSPVKRGFSENHNAAHQAAPADFRMILNPDVVLHEHCIREFLAAMQQHPRAGVVGPLLRYPDGTPQPSARRFPRPLGTLLRRTPLRRMAGERIFQTPHYLPPPTSDRTVDWLLGACLMVRAAAWRELGGFDPGYRPLYVEDIDLAWRSWRAGWEVWQAPAAEAVHEHQAATDKVFFDRRTTWHARGMLRFIRKHPRILVSGKRPLPALVRG